MPQLLNGSQQAASYWANLGFQPVPCVIFYDELEERHKKLIGYRISNGKIKNLSVNYKEYRWDGDLQPFEDASVGVICTENHAVHDHYLIKLDFDQKTLEAPDNALKIKFVRTFANKPVKVFGTVSGGIGALVLCSKYYPANSPIFFQGIQIGHTSDFNVVPPSDGYTYIQDSDLKPVDLEDFGIEIGLPQDHLKNDDDKAQYELGRYREGLSLMVLAYAQDLYHDSYPEWLKLLLIGRSLSAEFPQIADAFKDAFIHFSHSVGTLSGEWNDQTEAQIEREWAREDKGGLGIPTLEDWVKTFIPRSTGNLKNQLKAFIPKNKLVEDIDRLVEDSLTNGISESDRYTRLLEISNGSNLHTVTKVYDEKLKVLLSARDAAENLETIRQIEADHLDLDEFVSIELAGLLTEFSYSMGYEPEGVLLRLLTDISALYKTPTKVVLMPDRKFEVSPNIFSVIVAPTGVKKGALDSNITQPLYTYAQLVLDDFYRNQISNWQAEGCKGIMPTRPLCLHTDYSTVEGLISQVEEYPDMSILLAQDEIESFFANESYGGRAASQRAFYLKAYDGAGASYKRKGITVYIRNIQLTISGLIQDDILYKYVTPENVNSGLIGRFALFQQSKHKPKRGKIISQVAPVLENLGKLLVEAIGSFPAELETPLEDWQLANATGTNVPQPRKLYLTPEASELFTDRYYEIEDAQYNETDVLKAALLGKTQGKIGKFAAALHALKFAWSKHAGLEQGLMLPKQITAETMQAAIDLVKFYDARTLAVYTKADGLKGSSMTGLSIKILEVIRRNKTSRGTLNRVFRSSTPTQIESALQVLIQQGLITVSKSGKATSYTIS
jgi:Protein of unknown function (DUF3987)